MQSPLQNAKRHLARVTLLVWSVSTVLHNCFSTTYRPVGFSELKSLRHSVNWPRCHLVRGDEAEQILKSGWPTESQPSPCCLVPSLPALENGRSQIHLGFFSYKEDKRLQWLALKDNGVIFQSPTYEASRTSSKWNVRQAATVRTPVVPTPQPQHSVPQQGQPWDLTLTGLVLAALPSHLPVYHPVSYCSTLLVSAEPPFLVGTWQIGSKHLDSCQEWFMVIDWCLVSGI